MWLTKFRDLKLPTQLISVLLAISTLLGGYVAFDELFLSGNSTHAKITVPPSALTLKKNTKSNNDSKPSYDGVIPVYFQDNHKFREFLDTNSGEIVKLSTVIDFTAGPGVPESILAAQQCNSGDFFDAVNKSPSTVLSVSSTTFGFPTISKNIESANIEFFYDSKLKEYVFTSDTSNLISCLDQLRIVVKDPRSLRFSHGGTHIVGLPLWGDFLIEIRHFSGPRIEYTLREI